MMETLGLTAKIEKERLSTGEAVYVALCLELDIASQGSTVEEAKANLIAAVALFLQTASAGELAGRLPTVAPDEVFLTRIEVPIGKAAIPVG